MKINPSLYKKEARIEMLPLIDIVFLLLIFFICAMLSMAVHKGMSVSLPGSASVRLVKENAISISIMEDRSVYVDQKKTSLGDLKTLIESRIKDKNQLENKTSSKNKTETLALLFADKTVQYQDIFLVLDEIKAAGVEKISLQADALSQK